MRVRGFGPTIVAVAVLVLGSWAVEQGARAQSPDKAELAARGRVTYRVYCSNCHGATAQGDGSLASLLKVAPTDLTKITERSKGDRFPADEVRRKIDGRELVSGHGQGEMPVWGLSFQVLEKEGDQEPEVQAKLDQLVAFIESIQVTPKR